MTGKAKLLVIGKPTRPELGLLSKLPTEKVDVVKVGLTFEDVDEAALASVDAVFVGAGPTGATSKDIQNVFGKLSSVQWIHSNMAGLDLFMFPELLDAAKGITVTNSKGVYSSSLAEYALFAAKYFALNTPRLLEQKGNHHWEKFPVEELAGKTLSVIGYGDIGQKTGMLAKAFGMRVLASRRNPTLSSEDPVVEKMFAVSDIKAMVSESDYVVVSTPLTSSTKHIVNAEVIGAMKPSAVVINIGRGPCIDETALIEALKAKKIKGAGLDVFEEEPLQEDSELWDLNNVLISPHNADQVQGWLENSVHLFLENMERYLKGDKLQNIVDIHRGY